MSGSICFLALSHSTLPGVSALYQNHAALFPTPPAPATYNPAWCACAAGATGSGPNGGCAPYTLEIRDDCVVTLRDCVVSVTST
jgi:hypothetical protein